jgi:hypothetical protein
MRQAMARLDARIPQPEENRNNAALDYFYNSARLISNYALTHDALSVNLMNYIQRLQIYQRSRSDIRLVTIINTAFNPNAFSQTGVLLHLSPVEFPVPIVDANIERMNYVFAAGAVEANPPAFVPYFQRIAEVLRPAPAPLALEGAAARAEEARAETRAAVRAAAGGEGVRMEKEEEEEAIEATAEEVASMEGDEVPAAEVETSKNLSDGRRGGERINAESISPLHTLDRGGEEGGGGGGDGGGGGGGGDGDGDGKQMNNTAYFTALVQLR